MLINGTCVIFFWADCQQQPIERVFFCSQFIVDSNHYKSPNETNMSFHKAFTTEMVLSRQRYVAYEKMTKAMTNNGIKLYEDIKSRSSSKIGWKTI